MPSTSERLDALEQQVEAIKQAFRLMVKTRTFDEFRVQVGEMAKLVMKIMEGGSSAVMEDANPIQDKTPFPPGFSPAGGGAQAASGPPPPPPSAPPQPAANLDSDDESVPNVVSGPATNVRPNLTNRSK